METTLTRLVIIETTAWTLVVVKSAARSVIVMETTLTRLVIVKAATRSVVVVETAFTRLVVIKTTARTLVIIKSAAGAVVTTAFTVFIVEAAAGTVTELTFAEPAVATFFIKATFTSRLVASSSLFMSFLVTVTVIELEGPPLLEFFFSRLSGARTLARSFVVSHLIRY